MIIDDFSKLSITPGLCQKTHNAPSPSTKNKQRRNTKHHKDLKMLKEVKDQYVDHAANHVGRKISLVVCSNHKQTSVNRY